MFGDIFPQAKLQWNAGVHNYMVYGMANIPVGAYDPDRLSNLGLGHSAVDGGFGYTYFNPHTGWEATAVGGLTYNFTNRHTDYKRGIDSHVDVAASKFITPQIQIGVVGYAYQQITGDTGSGATLGPFKSRVFGAGPQIGFIFPVGNMQGYLNLNFSTTDIARRAIERRAVEAVIWGMPAVNYHLMYQEMVRKTKGGFNQVLYWSRLLDWKNQTLTPNPDVIYLMPFFNTKDVGPVVLEIPPADEGLFNGSVMNYWQAAIEDVGPGGVDKGKGGKYLILPPGYDRSKVPAGYIAMPSDTYQGYALLRSVLEERQRGRYRQGRRLRQAHQGLSALAGGQSAADDLRRCERRRVRFHHSLRPALLRVARSDGAGRAVAGTRQGDDRPAQDHRHRARQALQSGREDAGRSSTARSRRRRPGSRRGTTRCRPSTTASAGSSRPPRKCSRA